MRRLDCSIAKANNQRLGNMDGSGKKGHTERLDTKIFDS